jgi:DNA-binding NarL/FixJ family response regulator
MKNFVIFSDNTVYRETIAGMAADLGISCLASELMELSSLDNSVFPDPPDLAIIDFFSKNSTDDFISKIREKLPLSGMILITCKDNPLINYYLHKYSISDILYVEDDYETTQKKMANIIRRDNSSDLLCGKGHLTVRECEVLKLIAAGMTSREIADELFISKNTVDTHRNKMLQKLNLSNSASLVRYACRSGLL